ncbi:DEAD/DEAH box helicase [Litoribacter ruber]|uniref:DEAD/DEAH box helicase n=1 Tax=Litoribacter ruber TaxID=702568 RepID=UPI001BD9A43B|nr:DEAD/DEAH box helicase [Litoribacter ruber]MBT0812972.1 DEAD/DEAH box helicase [Litoribacter ruber]
MPKNKNLIDKIANLAESFADLAASDLVEARAVLSAAGKNPDTILDKGMKRIEKIRSSKKNNYKNNPMQEENVNLDARDDLKFLTQEAESATIIIEHDKYDSEILSAEEVFSTFIKKQPFRNSSYQNLKVSDEVKALKFHKITKELCFIIKMQAEYAKVVPVIKGRQENIFLNNNTIQLTIKSGYYIHKEVCFFLDKESLVFAESFLKDQDQSGQMALGKALSYFSKRNCLRWITFNPDILDIKKITGSNVYSKESNLFIRDLYGYQKEGLQWLQYCCINRIGGILGDDMGLGKTAQTIALIAWLTETDVFKNILIVVPGTLIENWRREFAFFTPDIVPYIHHGTLRTGSVKLLETQRVVITSYSMIINDQFLFNKINWGLVLLDEASHIKNPNSERRVSLKNISANVRIAMTGTPVENSLVDLWSLVDYVNPGYLGTKEAFSERYIRKDIEKTLQESSLSNLRKDISHIMLRRKKEDVLDSLPIKIDIHQALELSFPEAQLYEQQRESILSQASAGEKGHILKLIQDLRQYTTHPLLSEPNKLHNSDIKDLSSSSTKFKRALEILDEIRSSQEKVLIFTEYLNMIDVFKRTLSSHYGIEIFNIDGRMEINERQQSIDRFTESKDFGIMVLNPKTAGMGLNITAANHVIHYTRQWNPALEEQATARAYRNKQTKGVNVYYLFYTNTIEEIIDNRLKAKTTLSGEVISITDTETSMQEYLNALSKSPFKNP